MLFTCVYTSIYPYIYIDTTYVQLYACPFQPQDAIAMDAWAFSGDQMGVPWHKKSNGVQWPVHVWLDTNIYHLSCFCLIYEYI